LHSTGGVIRTSHQSKEKVCSSNVHKTVTFFSSSLFEPKMASRLLPSSVVRPSLLHLSWENTSSTGMCSYSHPGARKVDQTTTHTDAQNWHIYSLVFSSLSLSIIIPSCLLLSGRNLLTLWARLRRLDSLPHHSHIPSVVN
jgi:hypothetical protein